MLSSTGRSSLRSSSVPQTEKKWPTWKSNPSRERGWHSTALLFHSFEILVYWDVCKTVRQHLFEELTLSRLTFCICTRCHVFEDYDHLFFKCHEVSQCWYTIDRFLRSIHLRQIKYSLPLLIFGYKIRQPALNIDTLSTVKLEIQNTEELQKPEKNISRPT